LSGERHVYLNEEEYARLADAKIMYEGDTEEKIDFGRFISLLTSTYMIFREKRGKTESTYLREILNKTEQQK